MTQEMMLTSFDGTKLFMTKDIPTNPKAALVLVHGMCEHQGRYGYLVGRLCARGYAVYRFDHRGHGKSEGKRIFYSDFGEIIEDLNAATDEVRRDFPKLPVLLLGHSMGGYAVALYGIKYPGRANGIVLSGPITFNNSGIGEEFCAGNPLPDDFCVGSGTGVSTDPAIVKEWEDDPLVYKQITAGLLYSMLDGVKQIKKDAGKFTDPALFLHGGGDIIVSEKDSRDMYGAIGSKDKELKIYANLYHEIFNEPQKDEVIDDLLKWLDKHIS